VFPLADGTLFFLDRYTIFNLVFNHFFLALGRATLPRLSSPVTPQKTLHFTLYTPRCVSLFFFQDTGREVFDRPVAVWLLQSSELFFISFHPMGEAYILPVIYFFCKRKNKLGVPVGVCERQNISPAVGVLAVSILRARVCPSFFPYNSPTFDFFALCFFLFPVLTR